MPRIRDHAAYFSPQVSRTRRFYHAGWRRDAASGAHLDVVAGGCEWCAPEFHVEREQFPYAALEFVWAGRGRVRLGRRRHALSPGHAFILDPGVPHAICSDPGEPLVKYFFNFAGARISALLAELKLPPGSLFSVGEPARLAELLDEAIDSALQGSPLGLRASSAVLERALVLCAESRRSARARPDPAFATYLRCRNYLLRQYPALSSIDEAARACSVSAAYFTRLFQRFDRETPVECLRRLKLNEALLQLRQPGSQAKAVAAQLGFKSAAHFSRAFKSYHGMSPSAAMRVPAGRTKPSIRSNAVVKGSPMRVRAAHTKSTFDRQ